MVCREADGCTGGSIGFLVEVAAWRLADGHPWPHSAGTSSLASLGLTRKQRWDANPESARRHGRRATTFRDMGRSSSLPAPRLASRGETLRARGSARARAVARGSSLTSPLCAWPLGRLQIPSILTEEERISCSTTRTEAMHMIEGIISIVDRCKISERADGRRSCV